MEEDMAGYVASAETEVSAAPAQVWAALTDPQQIEKFMFGSRVETDWRPGSPIVWTGEYEGKAYQDKGEIVEVQPERRLVVTHYSPLSGQPDVPENYHTVSYELEKRGTRTHVRLSQDNNASEAEADHSRGMWEMMLNSLKEVVERG
jgi:uncharacterized protein YndB with AHSA1/START domain